MTEEALQVIALNPQFAVPMEKISSLCKTKRWHELGVSLVDFFSNDLTVGHRRDIYQIYVSLYASSLNDMHHAHILLLVSEEAPEPAKAIDFLNGYLPNFNGAALYMLKLRIIDLHTQMRLFEDALEELHEVESHINESTSIEVRAEFHKTQAKLDKARDDFDSFYFHALAFLSTSCISADPDLAYDLCVAALFSQKVCSFGELANHSIINSLIGTPNEWLCNLIKLLDRGDSDSISEFYEKFAPIIQNNEAFASHYPEIQVKVELSVFLEMIFIRPFNSRIFTFDEVAQVCHLEKANVELLVMKALSAEIVKGQIDEVNEKIIITWCKPKALGTERLKHLKQQIDNWVARVHEKRIALERKSQPLVG